jgi:hypothetical protein
VKPTFLKTYDPDIGICIQDIPGGSIGETYEGEKVIYFSDTVEDEEEYELSEIFYVNSKKYSKNYADVFHDLGWTEVSSGSYIFGQIEIKEISSVLENYK